jgi:heme/copper-type cytochrome/quinol oxidase subunit 2
VDQVQSVTELSELHFALLAGCTLVTLAVFAVMLHSIATFRKARGSTPAAFIRSALIETLWAIVPVAILFGAAVPAVKVAMATREVAVPAFAMSRDRSATPAQAPLPLPLPSTVTPKP